jgi:hypothetical protein
VSKETWDVLQQEVTRSYHANALDGGRPHVAFILIASSLAGNGERLTGETGRKDFNHASVLLSKLSVKFSDVHLPNGEGFKASVLNSLFEHSAAVFVDFDCTYAPPSEQLAPQ